MAVETTHVEPPIDDAFLQQFMSAWQAVWNSHDPERVVAMMTTDCTYDDAGWHKIMRGHDDVREFLRRTWRALPDMEFWWATFARAPSHRINMADLGRQIGAIPSAGSKTEQTAVLLHSVQARLRRRASAKR